MRITPLLLLSVLASGLAREGAAQSASYTYFGSGARQGCSPVQPVVGHQAVGVPTLGTTFSVLVSSSTGTCSYLCNRWFLLTGFSTTSAGGIPLPMPLGCGSILVSPDLPVNVPFGSGNQVVSFPIPNDPAFAGVEFYQQAVAVTCILGGVNAIAPGHGGRGVVGF